MPTVTGSVAISGAGAASVTIYSSWANRPYMMLDGVSVTDHGRQSSLSTAQMQVMSVSTARGSRRHFYPRNSSKASISVQWKLVPDTSLHTFDGREGRIYLKSLASSKRAIALNIKKADGTGYRTYSVYVNEYQESLVMRRNFDGGVLYDISMGFTEL